MSRPARLCALTLMFCCPVSLAYGTSAPAGSVLASQAFLAYDLAGSPHSAASNTTSDVVQELLDFTLEWADEQAVPAFAGDRGQVLRFRLTNTGNGSESFNLTALGALTGDDFDPQPTALYLDADGDGQWNLQQDTLYEPGQDVELTADQSVIVFLVCDLPPEPDEDTLGNCKLAVGSATGYGEPGTIVYEGGDLGTDAVIGPAGGFCEASGTFVVVLVALTIAKEAFVRDPDGGSLSVSGAVITYTITVSALGGGTARGVIVSDPLPPYTTFISDSLQLNGQPLTNAADDDPGDMGISAPGEITVSLGDLTEFSPVQQILFQVVID